MKIRQRYVIATAVAAAVILALALAPSAFAAGKGGGKPPKDDPPALDPAIVYQVCCNGIDIAVADADGSNQTVILSIPDVLLRAPSWAPDGDAIYLFSDLDGPGVYRLPITDRLTGETGLLELIVDTNIDFGSIIRPRPSPEDIPNCGYSAIAFVDTPRDENETLGEHYVIYLAIPVDTGYRKVRLTDTQDRDEISPTWSPDARRLAFHESVRDPNGELVYDILVFDVTCDEIGGTPYLSGGESLVLLDEPSISPLDVAGTHFTSMDWSNTEGLNGESFIAVTAFIPPAPNNDIWIIPVDAPADAFNLTAGTWGVWPTWSPDDTQIVFFNTDRSSCYDKGPKLEGGIVVRNVNGAAFEDDCESKSLIDPGKSKKASLPDWWRNHVPSP